MLRFLITRKKIGTMYGDTCCEIDLQWSFLSVYKYGIITLYTETDAFLCVTYTSKKKKKPNVMDFHSSKCFTIWICHNLMSAADGYLGYLFYITKLLNSYKVELFFYLPVCTCKYFSKILLYFLLLWNILLIFIFYFIF